MSSFTSQRRSRGSNLWSEWKWNSATKELESFRINARGKKEWRYSSGQSTSGASAGSNVPRFDDSSPLEPVSANTTQYSVDRNYTTGNNDVGSLTNSLAATTLTSIANVDPPIVAKLEKANTSTEHTDFDPNYKVHQKREFKFGRVFKVLWSEPSGEARGGTITSVRRQKHGEDLYAKVRRFVIIDHRRGHCLCLPIMTYRKRGTTKPGVHAEEHAIIYTTPYPQLVEGEDGNKMVYRPVRVIPDSTRHHLEASSRLNYHKVCSVEYNVKVWFIGHVHQDFEKTVARSYNEANPPLRLSTPPTASGSYAENNPTYSNSPRAMAGNSSNITGYPTFSNQPNIPTYGNTTSQSTPSYGTGYNTGSNSSNLDGGYSAARQNLPTQYTSSLYPASQHPPSQYPPSQYPQSQYPPPQNPPARYPSSQYPSSQYPPSQYPPSQYSTSQYPPSQYPQYPSYTPNTNQQYYNPQSNHRYGSGDVDDPPRYSDGQS
ncbi:hypothetical protein sscle_01g000360 [Sclerotinia sclerotiorum 1980 UF-70]|uniref:DUF6590 domain-containing protein n=1 Tax=Sclerotinia sclerotiorum (strain ATCC 18683 / 1980 / Ss-1) TaxID=665079 RepID=A0A1D9PRH1_SCLS1|nr:hypothetical protein sscle_01g000360 [Sclerotinia sclerotiorum 1980 UF-70]